MVTATGDIIVAQGHYAITVGGGQPGTGAPSASAAFDIQSQIRLPE